jgi:4-methyl-5(b-hydroxyethyl)-thiazole monophosphate biosynthesis
MEYEEGGMLKVLALIADGSEEMEAVIVVDVLRRAGWDVTVAAVGEKKNVTASRGVVLAADCLLKDTDTAGFDLLFLPGGKGGTEVFSASESVQALLQRFDQSDRAIAAICAAPLALDTAGVLKGRRYTCYPGVEKQIKDGMHRNAEVVMDGNLTTSKGPGTAFAFALQLVARYESDEKAFALANEMVLAST